MSAPAPCQGQRAGCCPSSRRDRFLAICRTAQIGAAGRLLGSLHLSPCRYGSGGRTSPSRRCAVATDARAVVRVLGELGSPIGTMGWRGGWTCIPTAYGCISSASRMRASSSVNGSAKVGGARATHGRSAPTRSPLADRRPPTPTSGGGWSRKRASPTECPPDDTSDGAISASCDGPGRWLHCAPRMLPKKLPRSALVVRLFGQEMREAPLCRAFSCAAEDSNLHPVIPDQALNLARLPIPPSARVRPEYSPAGHSRLRPS
jgi:hypothetical protein